MKKYIIVSKFVRDAQTLVLPNDIKTEEEFELCLGKADYEDSAFCDSGYGWRDADGSFYMGIIEAETSEDAILKYSRDTDYSPYVLKAYDIEMEVRR